MCRLPVRFFPDPEPHCTPQCDSSPDEDCSRADAVVMRPAMRQHRELLKGGCSSSSNTIKQDGKRKRKNKKKNKRVSIDHNTPKGADATTSPGSDPPKADAAVVSLAIPPPPPAQSEAQSHSHSSTIDTPTTIEQLKQLTPQRQNDTPPKPDSEHATPISCATRDDDPLSETAAGELVRVRRVGNRFGRKRHMLAAHSVSLRHHKRSSTIRKRALLALLREFSDGVSNQRLTYE